MTVPSSVRELALTGERDALAAEITRLTLERVFASRTDLPGLAEAVRASADDNLRALFGLLAGDVDPEDVHPDGALAFADAAAELGLEPRDVERAYRFGHQVIWRDWSARAHERAARTGEPVQPLLDGPSAALFGFVDRVLSEVFARYDTHRAELLRTREHVRRQLVANILDGTADADAAAESTLNYRFGAEHLAIHIEGITAGALTDLTARARATAGDADELLIAIGLRSWIMWLGRRAGWDARRVDAVAAAVSAGGDQLVAVSDPARGERGLREGYEQLLELRALRAVLPESRPVLHAREVRLEALVLQDRERARSFLRHELGDLADREQQSDRLCETLLAWLTGGSHVAAAAALGVHENTVRNRLRQIETVLGPALVHRRAELVVALRLRKLDLDGQGRA